MADDRADRDPGLGARLLEALDVLGRMVGRPPGARALREDLDGLGAELDRPTDRGVDASGGGDVGAGEHGTTITGCPSAPALHPARPASSTSAAYARRSSTGSLRATRAGSSCFASRTRTRAARSRSPSSRSSARSAGSGSTGTGRSTFQLDSMPRHAEDARRLLADGHAYEDDGAIRFRMPDEGVTAWDDAIKGRIEYPNEKLEDLVLLRSDGRPTYNLAAALDDADSGITHVIRGEDHVSNTPEADPDPRGARARRCRSTRTSRTSSGRTARSSRSATAPSRSRSSGRRATSRRR